MECIGPWRVEFDVQSPVTHKPRRLCIAAADSDTELIAWSIANDITLVDGETGELLVDNRSNNAKY